MVQLAVQNKIKQLHINHTYFGFSASPSKYKPSRSGLMLLCLVYYRLYYRNGQQKDLRTDNIPNVHILALKHRALLWVGRFDIEKAQV